MDTSKEFPKVNANDLDIKHYLESFCEKAKDILNEENDKNNKE
jgi:hypothetical protein